MRKKGFTLIELLVVISIIAMLLAILMPALGKVKKIAMRVVCATNLKGMGTAQMVYANDYDDEYAVQGAGKAHTWADNTDDWDNEGKNWKTDVGNITVGASLFLLVREADVSTKSFKCPSGDEKEFSGENDPGLELVELWDFGPGGTTDEGPIKCVSYSYQRPYAGTNLANQLVTRAATGTSGASMAMMADKSPFFEDGLTNRATGDIDKDNYSASAAHPFNWIDGADKNEVLAANAESHGREGQNVLFGDGHTSFDKRVDVGVQNENIYLSWAANAGAEADRRGGVLRQGRDGLVPEHDDDSVLVNDDAVN